MWRVLALGVALMFSGPAPDTALGRPADRLPVVASFYPLYEFGRHIGGDRVIVRSLVPTGVEPHHYEPTPRDVIALQKARVVVYNGAGFEPWLQRLLPQLPPRVVRVKASEGIPLVTRTAGAERGATDPHVWLDPVLARRQVGNIAAGLVRADPDGRTVYEANAAAYARRLAGLHDRIARTLGPCRKRVFITSHAAFGYFAARYGLTEIAIAGLSPEAEPSAAKIREILRIVRQHGVGVIYYETLTSPRVASTIAREAGGRTLVLNPIEGVTADEQRQGKHYLSIMEENLRNLVQGLDCP